MTIPLELTFIECFTTGRAVLQVFYMHLILNTTFLIEHYYSCFHGKIDI